MTTTVKTTSATVKKIHSDDSKINQIQSWLKTSIAQLNASIASLTTAANAPTTAVTSVTASAPLASSGGLTPNLSLTSPLGAANGGTGRATLTAHAVLLGEGTSAAGFATVGTAGNVLTDQGSGADPIFAAPTAPNFVQSSAVTGSGTTTVSGTTGNIQKKRSGSVLVIGSCSGTIAAPDTITVTLVRDLAGTPTTIATQTVTASTFTLSYSVTLQWIDTLPDALTHTYSIRLSGSQNNTVAANQALIVANEL